MFDKCCENEEWVDVKGYEPFYKISSCGQVITCRTTGGLRTCDKIGIWKPLKKYITLKHRGHQCYQVVLYRNGKRKQLTLHRLIYESFKNAILEKLVIDHIDHNPLNNHLSNLRLATQAQNQINSKNPMRGVHKIKSTGKYRAKIAVNGIEHWLGVFKTQEEAYAVRREAEIKYYGEFSNKL